jgi:two-component system chemotaxis sensor kinase CheA
MGKFRDGMPVTGEAVALILVTIDRIKALLDELEQTQREPEGTDEDLISELDRMSMAAPAASPPFAPAAPEPVMESVASASTGTLIEQVLERPLKPGEVSLDDLERAFREAPGPELETPAPKAAEKPAAKPAAKKADSAPGEEKDDDKSESKIAKQSIRVNVDTLEKLMTMVSELVLTRNQLLEMARRQEDSEFKVPLQRLSNVTAELQENVMKTRMQPVGNAWQKLPRVVRDLATELGKQIDLEMHGAETELDRQVLDRIKDPLTHMVRNSADHGLETPADRLAAGKPEKGTIRLSAYHEGGHIILEIADDGRGLDTQKIKAKAIDRGLKSAAEIEKMSEAQIQRFIFEPGFSTAAKVTNVSGRGVGMDVVQTNIDQIGGSIDVKSVVGEGSVFTIKIPLTLAIVSALIIEAGGERFAMPQLAVVELVRVQGNSEHKIERIKDTPVLRLRNKLLPLVRLSTLLKLKSEVADGEETGFIVVTQIGNRTFGIVVDGVFHTEEIVVKPMATKLRHISMFSGNTILGDGSVIMIIDPNGIAEALGTFADSGATLMDNAEHHAGRSDQTTSLLVFRAGSREPKAVPLSLVTRLEEVDATKIEVSNGRYLLQYRGQLMPLVKVTEDVRIKDSGTQSLLVFADGGRCMALAVDEIVDIVEDALDIEVASDQSGILGSAIIKNQATEIIDVGHYLPIAFADWFQRNENRPAAINRQLLFVEDSAFFRNMLTPVLRAAGYEVTAVAGGEDAFAQFKKGRRFDVVVTDLEMPGMDGFALVDAIRSQKAFAEMPIIALSSLTSPEAIAKVRHAGFDDFVAKFDRQGLIAALKEQSVPMHQAA